MMDWFQNKGYTIVTKKGCTWSQKAKHHLKRKKIEFVEIQISQNNMSKETWGYKKLKLCYKTQTFPVLFHKNGKKIGGYDKIKLL